MADYYPLIARAVAGLDKNTGENRRALYERARAALVAQLRGVDPPLEETEVTRERLALEESIRKVEAEAARRARTEVQSQPAPQPPSAPPPSPPAPPPAPPRPPMTSPAGNAVPQRPAAPPPPPSPPASRPAPSPFTVPQPPEPRAPLPPFTVPQPPEPRAAPPLQPGNVPPPPRFEPRRAPPTVPPPPPAPRAPVRPRAPVPSESLDDLRRDFGAAPPQAPSDDPFADLPVAHDFDRLDTGAEPRIDPRALRAPREKVQPFNLEPPPEPEEPPRKRGRILTRKEAGQDEPEGLGRSYGGIIKAAIAVVLLIGLVGFGYWQRSTLAGLYQAMRGSPATQTTRPTTAPAGSPSQPKIGDRIGQPGQAAGPAVAQRVVLYEEEPSDPQGKRYIGSAIWRTETVSPGPGQPPELAVRADVEIPERRITMKFSIRRNTDSTLPASHTVEIMFNLPADFAGGGIANVPGILMKQSEQTRGVPLAGLAVKVMTGFFLIGLSATEADLQRNVQLLKERAWFDIPVVYGNNRRAILALEKGTPGERAFAEAFATWKQ